MEKYFRVLHILAQVKTLQITSFLKFQLKDERCESNGSTDAFRISQTTEENETGMF
jgi:hypothetical protein